jgi:TP901 family phage tail tape measure protein
MAATEVVARFTADISDVQSKMRLASGAFNAVGEAAAFSSKRIAAVGQSMADAGAKMTVGLTLPLGGLAVASANAAMSFETNMSKITGLVGIAADEVARLGDEVLGMAGAVGKSPDELAAGLFVVTSAGLRGAEAMATLSNSAKAGAAGLGETNDIARAVAGALSAYGSEVLSASAATDAIVATARAGNFETSQFAAAIGRVLPFAKQAGASFQDMGGAVALLTRVNGNAAESITQIQALFRAVVVPTEEAKTALQDVGMSAQFLRDSIASQGLPATLAMLDKALGGNREQLGRLLGSAEAASAAFQILDADSQTIKDTFGVVANSAGMTAEAFGVVSGTSAFQVNQAMSELKATLIDLGNQFLPIIKSIADFVTANLRAFSSLPGPIKTTITVMAGFLAVLGPILFVVGKLIVVFSTLLSLMLKTRAVAAMRAAFLGLRGEMAAARVSMQQTKGTMASMGVAAKAASLAVVTSFKAIGAAAKGLLASLGPIGIAMLALGAVFEVLVGQAAGTAHHLANLRDEIDATTGKMTEAGKVFIATELRHNISKDDLAMMESYGISISGFISALEQGGPALDEYRNKITEMQEAQKQADGVFGTGFLNVGTVQSVNVIVSTLDGMIGQYENAKLAGQDYAKSVEETAAAATAADALMTSATVAAAHAAGMAAGPTKQLAGALGEVRDAAGEVVTELQFMQAEMESWLAVTGQISAVDAAAASIDNLGKASVDFGTDLMGQTPKARDFRAQVVSAFEDSANAAASLSDDIPTQRAIFTGELIKIVNALKASGVKPKDIEAFLGAMDTLPASVSDIMRSAAKAVGDTDFKSNIEKAFQKSVKAGAPMTADAMARLADGASKSAKEQLGLTLEPELASIIKSGTTALRPTAFNNGVLTGKSIGSGAAFGISQSSPIVQAAVARVMAQAKAAADAAVEADSPSKLFARTGDDIGSGVALGITRSAGKVKESVTKLARSLTTAFVSALQGDSGSVAAAINEVFGSIPAVKTPLEDALGVKGAEKFIKNNKKALTELLSVAEQIDVIMDKLRSAGEAAATLASLTAKPFGRPSEIAEIFGSSSDLNSVIDGYLNLRQVVTDAYAVLTDPDIVGGKAAARNRAALRATQKELRALATEAVNLHKAYEANAQAIVDLDKEYGEEVKGINDAYDVLDKAAAASIQSIEDRWNNTIPGLETALRDTTAAFDKENAVLQRLITERDQFLDGIRSGFRSFVNNLSFESRAATKAIMRETKTLADGVTVTLEREIEAGGGPASIRASLQERLDAVREFSRNIRTLMERGLDPSLVRDFVSAGVSGAGDAAAALAAGSQEDLAAINTIQSELLSEADGFASYASAQWHDIAIAQQEAIVGPLEVARDMAQDALKIANDARDSELKAAREHADALKDQRRTDLETAEREYNTERDRLLAEGVRLQGEMDRVAAEIQAIIRRVAEETALASARAAKRAAENLVKEFEKSYPEVAKKLGKLMDALAASMNRSAQIVVRTVYEAGNPLPRRAMGGPVRASTAYLVGERGPEVFVPNFSGNIIPNMGSVPSMGPRSVSANGGGSTYQITVNAGVGDPREIGRVTVEAIQAYERSNGRVFASA